jgi:hypothetical protein
MSDAGRDRRAIEDVVFVPIGWSREREYRDVD